MAKRIWIVRGLDKTLRPPYPFGKVKREVEAESRVEAIRKANTDYPGVWWKTATPKEGVAGE